MTETKKIHCTIDKKTGKVSMEAFGYVGESCKAATAPFERVLDGSVSDDPKPELFETEQEVEHDYERQG